MTPTERTSSVAAAVRRGARGPRGLRARATLACGTVALVVAVVMALGVWITVSRYLLAQREQVALAQTVSNATLVQRGLSGQGLSAPTLLAQLHRDTGSVSLLRQQDEWFTTALTVGRDDLPEGLREAVVDGQPLRQRIDVGGSAMLVVGLPLAGAGDAYFEVFPLHELDQSLRVLAAVLGIGVVVVPLVTLPLGWWVTNPALRSLQRVAETSAALADGDLEARIDPGGDPLLVPIALSFNQTASALQERMRSDARFAADVSHELRSPLTTMLSAVSLVDDHRQAIPARARQALDLLGTEMDRFERLVEDLLEISRSDAGSAEVVLEDIVLPELLRRTLSQHPRLLDRLVVDAEARDLVVHSDKRRLERVVSNLVDNAEQHGGGLRAVTVRALDGQALVSVEDAGPGLSVEERERVFERFARSRHSSRGASSGAGLGLSLVSRHLLLLGGTIDVGESAHGGARFLVVLPAKEPQ